MYRRFPPKRVLFILPRKCVSGIFLTWDMSDLQVVSLHYVYPLPDAGVNTLLAWEVEERSVACLYNYGVGPR